MLETLKILYAHSFWVMSHLIHLIHGCDGLLMARRTVMRMPLLLGLATVSITLPRCPQQALKKRAPAAGAAIRHRAQGMLIDCPVVLIGTLPKGSRGVPAQTVPTLAVELLCNGLNNRQRIFDWWVDMTRIALQWLYTWSSFSRRCPIFWVGGGPTGSAGIRQTQSAFAEKRLSKCNSGAASSLQNA
jgi:hypothetical protein